MPGAEYIDFKRNPISVQVFPHPVVITLTLQVHQLSFGPAQPVPLTFGLALSVLYIFETPNITLAWIMKCHHQSFNMKERDMC